MRRITQTASFRREYKLQQRRGKQMSKLDLVVMHLMRNGALEPSYKPHKLGGKWSGHLECHVESDWLLIYKVDDTEVSLASTGTHHDLFGK